MEGIIHNENGDAVKMAGTKATMTNLVLTLAATEYDYTLPAGTARFVVQARTAADVKMGVNQGESGTNYITIKSGASYSEDGLTTNQTLHFQTATAGTIMEIISWA
jgi:hypothetical protein